MRVFRARTRFMFKRLGKDPRAMNHQRLVRVLTLFVLLNTSLRASAWTLHSPMWNSPQTQQTEPTPDNNNNKNKKDKKNTGVTGAQPTANQPASTQPTATQPQSAPRPLFGGQVNLKSSRQSKDTATLGFNGLDPNGQVQKGFLAAAPTSADVAKAQQLTRTGVNPTELTAFIQEGGLNATGGQQ